MAGGKHIVKKRRIKASDRGTHGGGKAALGIRADARPLVRKREAKDIAVAEKELPEKERAEIVRRVMARERMLVREKHPGVTAEREREQVERQKRLIMWSGVTFFMILIVVFWVYSFKLTMQSNSASTVRGADMSRLEDLTDELEKRLNEMNAMAGNIGAFEQASDGERATSSKAIFGSPSGFPKETPSATGTIAEDKIEQLENKLKGELNGSGQ